MNFQNVDQAQLKYMRRDLIKESKKNKTHYYSFDFLAIKYHFFNCIGNN